MTDNSNRPVLAVLTSHWLSMVGATLVTIAGFTWLLVLPQQMRGHTSNPYAGIILFVILPIVFFLGLALIPIGVFLARRRIRTTLDSAPLDRQTSLRRLGIFLTVATFLNVIIGSQLTYRAVEHMETAQFCGNTCHVMKPEFVAHKQAVHSKLACVECHVAPGVGGWVESKMSGTRQLMEVLTDSHPRPIPSAMESDRLVSSADTCEHCHAKDNFASAKLRLIPDFAADESNTPSQTVLMMLVGGSKFPGIHGSHFGPGISIRYSPQDAKRQTIPWVEYQNTNKGAKRVYTVTNQNADLAKLPKYEMQCVDCHNRPAHTFELAERALNREMQFGGISVTLPFIKKKSTEVLKTGYKSSEEAALRIPESIRSFYATSYPALSQSRAADIDQAAKTVLAIYNRNVFPDLKVSWGTYPNNLGHTDFPGCFRCHDGEHNSPDQHTITQDCGVCHETISVAETSPEILKTLGLADRIAAIQKK
ncbi:MAG TPA: NapC/NirT family cytochrome c [Bryobacteraceae bacterium]|nr:NapC/NirT family cytochrome c [Bryobacteraceae bacterium]